MNFHNLDKIMDNVNVHNKYLLTAIIAQRATQISENKGVNQVLARHPGEKAISLALSDLEDGNVTVQLQNEKITDVIESEMESEANEQQVEQVEPQVEAHESGEAPQEPSSGKAAAE